MTDPFLVLADTLMQREALLCRVGEGRAPRDFAGLYIDDDDLNRVLRDLPGLDGPEPATMAGVRKLADPLVAAARDRFRDSLRQKSSFADVVRAARLDADEAEVFAVLAAVDLLPARQRLVAYVQDSVQLPRITLGTLSRIFAEPTHRAELCLAPGERLRRRELVQVSEDGPWSARVCAPAATFLWHLRGADAPDPDLPAGALRSPGAGGAPDPGLLLVDGPDRESRHRAVRDLWPGTPFVISAVPDTAAQWAAVVREATVHRLAVVLEMTGPLDARGRDVINGADHLAWALSSATELPLECLPDTAWREIHAGRGEATPADWQAALGRDPEAEYRLSRDQLHLVSRAARADSGLVGPAVRRLAGGHLNGLAVRVRPRRTWDDLVLAGDDERQLRELAARHRGRGVVYGAWGFAPVPSSGTVALFAGPSGTGKTLAAEVVAGELGLDLYKIDLSAVVSKYIGETEKNLERIFRAAAAGDLVLFFDEADALFGRRSEVTDARDRYANIEVAYLLQRLETYDGLVILATNLQRNIDQAFLRRISVAVDFVVPEPKQRRAIWARSFAAGAPHGDLDLDFLARQFKITGGVISNAALGAAFLAADEAAPIEMRHVVLALKREFQKLGRMRTETEFERYFDLVRDGDDVAPPR